MEEAAEAAMEEAAGAAMKEAAEAAMKEAAEAAMKEAAEKAMEEAVIMIRAAMEADQAVIRAAMEEAAEAAIEEAADEAMEKAVTRGGLTRGFMRRIIGLTGTLNGALTLLRHSVTRSLSPQSLTGVFFLSSGTHSLSSRFVTTSFSLPPSPLSLSLVFSLWFRARHYTKSHIRTRVSPCNESEKNGGQKSETKSE